MLVFVLTDIILSLAFASGVKTVIPLPRNRLNIETVLFISGKG